MALLCLPVAHTAWAQETVCARVKIEIRQEMTLERQAFDAEMRILNTTDTGVIENVAVEVKVTDEAGTPVAVSGDPNDVSAKFFIRLARKENIDAVDGTGVVRPRTTGTINWLLIPAPGAAGQGLLGKKYLVGATLRYRYGGEETVLDVSPDIITVKPLPRLTLDYFLTRDVWADDPLTPEVEPAEPFTLGVRVKNNGLAVARNLKIDSAQPRIIENQQGLLVNFRLTGSYLDDAPVQNTLLIDFGDVPPQGSRMGRWAMETSLAGTFTEFSARFTHADELGGAMTSVLEAANAHTLIRDVRVDLPGRDHVKDFLAQDGDVIRVYESDGPDTEVVDRSEVATLTAQATGTGGRAVYALRFPPTAGFVYARLRDPFGGAKAPGTFVRSDAKELAAANVWLSRTRHPQTRQWEHWVHVFDVNSTGVYDGAFEEPAPAARPPVLRPVAGQRTQEGSTVSFLVEASSPDGRPVTLQASPLPAGARFTPQAADAASPGLARAVFEWTPAQGTAGAYDVRYVASDGLLSAALSARIQVEPLQPPPGPATPAIAAPLPGAQVAALAPALSVSWPQGWPVAGTQLQFEVYADEAMATQVAQALVAVGAQPETGAGEPPALASWRLPSALDDNTPYWWRVRSFDGKLYSAWAQGRFFVNAFNDPPDSFNLTSPAPEAEVGSLTPRLAWTNSRDRDGDAITYAVSVFADAQLEQPVAQAQQLPEHPGGSTGWELPVPLANHTTYYWRVVAVDAWGAQTFSAARSFTVNTGNAPPSTPQLVQPLDHSVVAGHSATLVVGGSTDADGDALTYVVEIDSVASFDSSDRRASGPLQGNGASVAWTVAGLVENRRYWWRARAQDGRAQSGWMQAQFLVSAANDPPPAPTVRNPGNGAWVATQHPLLSANAVVDPEGDALQYQFEVYADAALSRPVDARLWPEPGWQVSRALADQRTYWWRVRAVDAHGAASAWSAASMMYVSTAPYEAPVIAVLEPATITVPQAVTTADGARRMVTIRWEGTDPNIEPTVALYHDTRATGFAGSLIVDGLRQAAAGTHQGSHVWDVTDLAPGTYYVYAVIHDAKGVGRAYAPGAVVIAPLQQAGSVVVDTRQMLFTSETGAPEGFSVRLGSEPVADVVLALSSTSPGRVALAPRSLTFTPGNWSTPQRVTVTGKSDCLPEPRQLYQIFTGPASSLDGNFIGLQGKVVHGVSKNSQVLANSTNRPDIHVCRVALLSERRLGTGVWEYVLNAQLTNAAAAPLRGVVATLRPLPAGLRIVLASRTLRFGAVGQGETVKTGDTVTLHSRFQIPSSVFAQGIGLGFGPWFRWDVEVQP